MLKIGIEKDCNPKWNTKTKSICQKNLSNKKKRKFIALYNFTWKRFCERFTIDLTSQFYNGYFKSANINKTQLKRFY